MIPLPYKLLAGLLTGLFLFWFGYLKGAEHERNKQSAAYLGQVEAARKAEQGLQAAMDASTKRHVEEVRRIANERDAALDRLRNRPERLPEDARANCKGASGAELSSRDSEFLVRQASRADEQREALKSCYEYADMIGGRHGTTQTEAD